MAGQSGQPPPASHAHTPTGEQPPASTAPTGQQPPATAAPPSPTGQEPPASAMSGPLGGMVSDQVTVGQEGIGGEDATLSSPSLVDLVASEVVLAAAAAPPAPVAGQEIEPAEVAAPPAPAAGQEIEPADQEPAEVGAPPARAAGQEIEPAEVGAPPAPAADQEIEPAAPSVHAPAAESEQDQEPALRARLFAEFLELVKKKPHWMSGRATGKSMHPELLKPVRCGHCGQLEDLSRSPMPIPDATDGSAPPDHLVIVSDMVLVDQIAFEGNSCLTCVKMIYEKTRRLLCQRSSEQAGSDTPLHYAARSRNFRMLFHFICLVGNEYGLERVAQVLRKLNGRSETALHEAIWQGNNYMAELLMRVDPELARSPPPGQGTSPQFLAVSLGYGHIARMLLSRSDGNLSYSGPDGQNALHAAALQDYGMIHTLLHWNEHLSKEMDGDGKTPGSTPLHYVVSGQRQPKSLLFRICSLHFDNIWFPLENLATGRILRANTSAACQRDKNGLFHVHIAALMNMTAAIRVLLIGCPGCIGFRDNQGRSFLHIAVQNKSLAVVRYACKESRFASIMNAQDKDGNTALHLAVFVGDLSAFCALLANREVLLNIRNNKDQTPRDLAWNKKGEDFSYGWNPEWVIHRTIIRAGARSCSFWRDRIQQLCNPAPLESQSQKDIPTETPTTEKKESQEDRQKKEEKDKEESAKVTDSTRTLGIGSVLIASVTFTATFTVPAGIKASDQTKDGTPGLLDTWYFNAFMMANTLAFICSSIATVGLMFAGMPMVKLPIRRRHFVISVFFASSSLTCLNVAFALGVYMVLAPVGRTTAIAICVITPLVLVYRNAEHVHKMLITSWPIYVRRGIMFACWSFIRNIFVRIIMEVWPLVAIFAWAAHKETSSTPA